jgi:phosphatidylglycerol:prolipoprotein diacylglycerol transferase
MFPVLIKIGPLTIHTYGFLIATGFLVALALALRDEKQICPMNALLISASTR